MKHMHTGRLLLMAVLHFLIMYAAMFSMVNGWGNVIPNINTAYMAALMTAPMLMLEVILMGPMYGSRKALTAIFVTGAVILTVSFLAVRNQWLVNDAEFLRSMIPHHAGAILMCERAPVTDPEIQRLCRSIIGSQQSEIDQMKRILSRY